MIRHLLNKLKCHWLGHAWAFLGPHQFNSNLDIWRCADCGVYHTTGGE